VIAKVKLKGTKNEYISTALVDTGARMSLIDKSIADRIGVELTGREIDFVSVSGHVVRASEAVVRELEIERELLKYEAVAVAEIPEAVKETLTRSELDGRVIVGLLTLERANMLPDTATGTLKRVGSFIL
jgi:predicted aspartyl protease